MTPDLLPWAVSAAAVPVGILIGWLLGHLRGRSTCPHAPREADVERAAAAFHVAWASWAAALLKADEEGGVNLGDGRRARWQSLIRTPYAELDEDWKEKDRAWARYALGLGRRPS